MLKKLSIALALIIIIFSAYVFKMPDDFNYERSEIINVKPAQVFSHVNDLQKWQAWSPWAKLDPNAKTTFQGPEAGVGAIMQWDGNNEIGKGTMTIIESTSNESIKFQLDFEKPMKATNIAEFQFTPEGSNTKVTWNMYGKTNFIGKIIDLVFNCEKMVGEQFEKGLLSLKEVAEAK